MLVVIHVFGIHPFAGAGSVDASQKPVELSFGNETDVYLVSRWRAPQAVRANPAVRDMLLVNWACGSFGARPRHSAPFYAKALGVPGIQDHFFIRDLVLESCRRKFREKFFGQLGEA